MVKRPLFNHTKVSCVFCRGIFDKKLKELSPDCFSYLCIPCMEEYAERKGIEFDDEKKGKRPT